MNLNHSNIIPNITIFIKSKTFNYNDYIYRKHCRTTRVGYITWFSRPSNYFANRSYYSGRHSWTGIRTLALQTLRQMWKESPGVGIEATSCGACGKRMAITAGIGASGGSPRDNDLMNRLLTIMRKVLLLDTVVTASKHERLRRQLHSLCIHTLFNSSSVRVTQT